MRTFTLWIFMPAMLAMLIWAAIERGYVWRIVWVGAVAGFVAACAYDLFRVPFVFAKEWPIDSVVPSLPLFKVFPKFGFMIHYGYAHSEAAKEQVGVYLNVGVKDHVIGWAYHFSNGMTFGIMYLALIGDAAKRSWLWAVVFAVVLELGMLFTPYTKMFDIRVTANFIAVTLSAHVIFGIVLGLVARRLWIRATILQR